MNAKLTALVNTWTTDRKPDLTPAAISKICQKAWVHLNVALTEALWLIGFEGEDRMYSKSFFWKCCCRISDFNRPDAKSTALCFTALHNWHSKCFLNTRFVPAWSFTHVTHVKRCLNEDDLLIACSTICKVDSHDSCLMWHFPSGLIITLLWWIGLAQCPCKHSVLREGASGVTESAGTHNRHAERWGNLILFLSYPSRDFPAVMSLE